MFHDFVDRFSLSHKLLTVLLLNGDGPLSIIKDS